MVRRVWNLAKGLEPTGRRLVWVVLVRPEAIGGVDVPGFRLIVRLRSSSLLGSARWNHSSQLNKGHRLNCYIPTMIVRGPRIGRFSIALVCMVQGGLVGAQDIPDTLTTRVNTTLVISSNSALDSIPRVPDARTLFGVPQSPNTGGTKGFVEGRLVFGQLPMTGPPARGYSGALKAGLRQNVFGIPLRLDADLSTAVPARGRQNRVRFSVDVDALAAQARTGETMHLDAVRRELEELRKGLAELQRNTPSRIDSTALGSPLPDQSPLGSSFSADSLHINPDPPDIVQVPIAPGAPPADDTLTAVCIGLRMDSLERIEQRLTALVNAQRDALSGVSHVLASLRALELGECRPMDSEFLVRDISVQGAHVQVQRNDLFVDALYGRSFDDAWRTTTPDQTRLTALQQAAFFTSARDLNPRQLANLVVGYGSPDKDHAHLGVLYGRKYLVAAGTSLPQDPSELRNAVVQADIGIHVARDHAVSLVLARSNVVGSRTDGSALSPSSESDLLQQGHADHAGTLGWRSEFPKCGTTIEMNGRLIGADFLSLGMGFLRPGSKEASAMLIQRIAATTQIRIKGSVELRADAIMGNSTRIRRGQFALNWRPTSTWSINLNAQPISADSRTTSGVTVHQENLVMGAGSTYRKRIQHTQLLVNAQLDRYALAVLDGQGSLTWWASTGVGVQWRKGSSMSINATGPIVASGGGGSVSGNGRISFSERSSCELHIAAAFDRLETTSYGARIRRQVTKRITMAASFDKYGEAPQLFPEAFGLERVNDYYWELIFGCQW